MFGVCFFLSHPFISFSPGSNDWIFSPLLCVAGVLCVNFFLFFVLATTLCYRLVIFALRSLFSRFKFTNTLTHACLLLFCCVNNIVPASHTHIRVFLPTEIYILYTCFFDALAHQREKKLFVYVDVCVCMFYTRSYCTMKINNRQQQQQTQRAYVELKLKVLPYPNSKFIIKKIFLSVFSEHYSKAAMQKTVCLCTQYKQIFCIFRKYTQTHIRKQA